MAGFEDAGTRGTPEYSEYIQEVKIDINRPKGKQPRPPKDHDKKFADNMREFKRSLPVHLTFKHQLTEMAMTFDPDTGVWLYSTYTYKAIVE